METVRSLCPIVRDSEMDLFERVEVGGVDRFIPFKHRVLWLRESQTQIVLRHDEHLVKECSTLCDFYGYLKSLEEAITDDAAKLCKRFKIGKGDRLAVELILTITDQPVLEDCSQEAKDDAERYAGQKYRKSYIPVPSYHHGKKWWYLSDKRKDESDKYSPCPALESVPYHQNQYAWSSRVYKIGEVPAELAKWIQEERSK